MTDGTTILRNQIKQMMVQDLMLRLAAEDIADDLPLFGPGGLGLDSVDALQLVVALDKQYGLKITNPDQARTILQSVNSIAAAVAKHTTGSVAAPTTQPPAVDG